MEKAKRLDWIDMCRGFIMILVVFGHTLTYNSNLRFIIFTFHMPALFIISGYVFKPRPLKTSGLEINTDDPVYYKCRSCRIQR